jgi:aspartyl-tRNA(Asn)/glutamyl-tRNA(Gln) amidotransferase subunit A
VAWSPTLGYADVDAEVVAICERAVEVMASLGTEVVEVDTVFDEDPVDQWLLLTGAYNLRTHADLRNTEAWGKIDPVLSAVIERSLETSALDLVRAEDSCHALNLRLVELFHDVRLLITPTTAAVPPPRSLRGSGLINGVEDINWVKFTYPFNMTRSPAASICAGLSSSGLPVGLQLVGPQHGDLVVLRSAAALEAALGFDGLPPYPAAT